MSPNALALFVGPFTSAAGIIGLLLVLLVVIVVGRVVLSVAWRLVLLALAVSLGLWVLGAIGLSPL